MLRDQSNESGHQTTGRRCLLRFLLDVAVGIMGAAALLAGLNVRILHGKDHQSNANGARCGQNVCVLT